VPFFALAQEKRPAEDIVRESSETDNIPGWSAKVVMRLIPKSGSERVRESNIFSKEKPDGRDMQRLVQFISPADISGSNVLIHEHREGNDDIWIYLPSVKKVRRLLANSKKESFMGTDFTYTDITTPKVHEYKHTLLRQDDLNGASCYVIESVPKADETRRDTGYSKTVNWIRKDNFVRVKSEIHDLSGALAKVMQVHALKEVDKQQDKWLMEKVEMRDLRSGHVTILTFNNIRTDAELSDKLFAPGRLDSEKRP
jgi:outer membrane lipoprotein-sorting protein